MKYKWIGITVLIYLCTLIDGITSNLAVLDYLPGYAVIHGIERLNATRCRSEMIQYRDGINHRKWWGLTMLDSSGQPSSGYITGNNFWLGSKSQCDHLRRKQPVLYSPEKTKKYSLYRNPADEFPPFTVNFFGAYIRNLGNMQHRFSILSDDLMILGLCLPDSCTEHEVTTMLNHMFDNKSFLFKHLYSTEFELIKVSNLKNNYTWLQNNKMKAIIAILAAFLGIVVAGTLYDIFIYQKRLRKLQKCYTNGSTMIGGERTGDTDRNSHVENVIRKLEPAKLKNDMAEKPKCAPKAVKKLEPVGRIEQILVCFSITSNMKRIFQLKAGSDNIAAFNGIKFWVSTWLMFFHAVYYTMSVTSNKIDLYRIDSSAIYQLLGNPLWSADVFFFLAGFLSAYGHYKSQRKGRKVVSLGQNACDFLIQIIKRFIRLAPPYVVTMMLGIVIFSWTNNFLLAHFVEPVPEMCLKHGWRNILFIQNLFEWNGMCMTWTWQVACEMQFSIFSAFLLKLSVSHHYFAMNLGIITLILSMLSAGYVTYDLGHVKVLDSKMETISYVYMRPWIRIVAYIMAMGTARFLEKRQYKLHLSKFRPVYCHTAITLLHSLLSYMMLNKVLAAGWFISILCFSWVIFGMPFTSTSFPLTIIFELFNRLCWNLAAAWVVIVCLTDNAAPLNKFLSLSCWIPPSRVVYCTYLLNPIFALLLGVLTNYPIHAENYYYIMAGLGIWVMSYISGFILSAMTEVPTQLLLESINSRSKKEI